MGGRADRKGELDKGLGQRPANPGPRAKFGPRRIFQWPAWPCQ